MRCTKCGYISFDDLQSCTACSTDLMVIGALLKGTALQVEPTFFLSPMLEGTEETGQEENSEELVLADEEEESTLYLGEEGETEAVEETSEIGIGFEEEITLASEEEASPATEEIELEALEETPQNLSPLTDIPDPREMDVLLATGEQASIALLTMALQRQGLRARSYTGGQVAIRTDDVHSKAR
ncbi:MAG: hypothetical protein P8130_13755, partial [Deltaproteobacteria bacterium]